MHKLHMIRLCATVRRGIVSTMSIGIPPRMTVDEFLAWGIRQEKGRYELFAGRVVRQQRQSWGHVQLSWRTYGLLAVAIERAGVPFYAAPMGMTVRIADADAFEPDTLVSPLPKPLATDLEIPNPVLVVEVLSPSSVKRDLTGGLQPPITVREGAVELDPPGIALAVAEVFSPE